MNKPTGKWKCRACGNVCDGVNYICQPDMFTHGLVVISFVKEHVIQ